jgi:hypothetical protein
VLRGVGGERQLIAIGARGGACGLKCSGKTKLGGYDGARPENCNRLGQGPLKVELVHHSQRLKRAEYIPSS